MSWESFLAVFLLFFAFFCFPIVRLFPKSTNTFVKFTGVSNGVQSTTYVVCPSERCNAIYNFEDLLIFQPSTGNILGTKTCSAKLSKTKICGSDLLYRKNWTFQKHAFVPYKTFEFVPPSTWIRKFFQQDKFCQLLKERPKRFNSETMSDVQHGQLWKDLLMNPEDDEQELLKNSDNLALILNVDWFCPFRRSKYKVGALYMSVLNLPRRVRFELQWTMLVGLIPGPSEPKEHINTFLAPMVDDLLQLWKGMKLTKANRTEFQSKCLLFCVSSDLPASRKVTQFKSHKCVKSCDKCNFVAKRQPGTKGASGKMSFYTKARPNRPTARTNKSVRIDAMKYKNSKTKREAQKISKETGVKYSELLRLPYFDPVRMVVLDPMHAFFLGLIKNECDKHLNPEDCEDKYSIPVQKRKDFVRRLKSMRVPYDIGRLPLKHQTDTKAFSGLTAEQFQNYSLVYAKPCLINMIPKKAYDCFCLLSRAVKIVDKSFISEEDLVELEDILEEHHQRYKSIYGMWNVTINYHMVLHVPEMLRNFGPANGFWCFPFERYNGVLERTPTSGKSIEQQLMKYFQADCFSNLVNTVQFSDVSSILPSEYKFPSCISSLIKSELLSDDKAFRDRYSREYASAIILDPEKNCDIEKMVERQDFDESFWPVSMLHPKRDNLQITLTFRNILLDFFKSIYQDVKLVHGRINKYGRCYVNGTMYSSEFNITDRGSIVKAFFGSDEDEGRIVSHFYGRVSFFFKSKVFYQTEQGVESKLHDLAFINWLKYTKGTSTLEKRTGLLTVHDQYYDCENIINVRRLVSRCVLVPTQAKSKDLFVVEI